MGRVPSSLAVHQHRLLAAIHFTHWGSSVLSRHLLRALLLRPHPSPLSAHRGFFGSKPFSKTNEYLASKGRTTIDWTSVMK